jgi:hypothetical protein
MARTPIYDWDLLVLDLDGALPDNKSSGWSIDKITRHLGLPSRSHAREVIRRHRLLLGDDTYALLTQGGREAVYWLSADPAEIRRYNRIGFSDLRARVRRCKKMAARAVHMTRGNSTEGKLAREFELTLELFEMRMEDAIEKAG